MVCLDIMRTGHRQAVYDDSSAPGRAHHSIAENVKCMPHLVIDRRYNRILRNINLQIRTNTRAFQAFSLRRIPPKDRHPQPIPRAHLLIDGSENVANCLGADDRR